MYGRSFNGHWVHGAVCGRGELRYPPPDGSLLIGCFGEVRDTVRFGLVCSVLVWCSFYQ